jgi:hypothetical protein
MAWTDPVHRNTTDLISASIWNTDLVDNLVALHGVIPQQFNLTGTQTLTINDGVTSVRLGNASALTISDIIAHASARDGDRLVLSAVNQQVLVGNGAHVSNLIGGGGRYLAQGTGTIEYEYYAFTSTYRMINHTMGGFVNFTPVWSSQGTAPSLGNGTLTGLLMQVGNQILFQINLTYGSTTTGGTGAWLFTVVYTPSGGPLSAVVRATHTGTGAGLYLGQGALADATHLAAYASSVAPATAFTASSPVTFVNGDIISINGSFSIT